MGIGSRVEVSGVNKDSRGLHWIQVELPVQCTTHESLKLIFFFFFFFFSFLPKGPPREGGVVNLTLRWFMLLLPQAFKVVD